MITTENPGFACPTLHREGQRRHRTSDFQNEHKSFTIWLPSGESCREYLLIGYIGLGDSQLSDARYLGSNVD